MKINLSIFSSIMSRNSGGIENTTYYLAKELDKYTHVYVYVNENHETNDEIKTITTNERNVFKRFYKGSLFYRKHLRKNEICLCLNWRFAIIPFLNRVPYIVMCHGNDVIDYTAHTLREKLEKIIRKRILNNAIHICANSQYTAELVKIIRIKDEPSIIHPCSGEKVDFAENCTNEGFILSIGRLEERKGFQFVIEAFVKIHSIYPQLKYYIAGDGPFKQNLQSIIENNGLQGKVFLLGRVDEDKKQELLKTCNVLVMPSFFNQSVSSVEGFGIVYIEANAHGKPVIGTRSGGIPDAIVDGKTGLLVEEKNTEQLVNALNAILSGRVRITEFDCKKWASEHYYTEIAKKYITLIEELSKKNR